MTTTDKTKAIRQALKAAGVAARAVSVRARRGEGISVLINSAEVKKALVESIARPFESISRDHYSGEILCGGNTFVSVEYTDEALAALKAPMMAAMERLANGGEVDLGG
jgi:hypothetical protein